MSNRYTPASVSGTDMTFSIPLYQRLFEWGPDQINTLLDDLVSAYRHSEGGDRPYYIGMLTAIDNREKELVDGQQRFTVTTLMGIVMRKDCMDWDRFLRTGQGQRLVFKARPKDQEYLAGRIDNKETNRVNVKMERAIAAIESYLDNNVGKDMRADFCGYVFRNLTFFVSELPSGYKGRQLNKYFEAMNATGKNLENHEILKVNILSGIDGDKDLYTRIWNIVADMNRPLVRKRSSRGDKEDTEALRGRYTTAFGMFDRDDFIRELGKQDPKNSLLNDLYSSTDTVTDSEYPSIGDIQPRDEKPKKVYRSEGYRSMLKFTNFLLQVLWIMLDDKQREGIEVNTFFDNNNLLTTFKDHGSDIDGEEFISGLLKYRLLYDYYLIRISNEREDYQIEAGDAEEEGSKTSLKQFESLLYVYSSDKSYYLWFRPMMEHLMRNRNESCQNLLQRLKEIDNDIHGNRVPELSELTFQKIDRYWFWRLDYYIWERRDTLFSDGGIFSSFARYKPLVDNYILRRNRSVEHVSPQHPEGRDPLKRLHEFGNLVMISASMNSSLGRSEYAEKRGHVEACLANGLLIESLAMILLYKQHGDDIWTDEDIENRSSQMLELLKGTFPSE